MEGEKIIYRSFMGLMLIIMATACVTELEIESFDQKEQPSLVVEAILSDELKTQVVYLSRSDSRLDLETDTVYNPYLPLGINPLDSVTVESNAMVKVVATNGTTVEFAEGEKGTYLSNQPFALQMGVEYKLEISTESGIEYVSDPIKVQGTSQISNLYAERAISDTGVEGVAIFIDSEPDQGSSEYYRYTFEETYKIIAPYWVESDFVLTNYDPCALPVPTYDLEISIREVQNRVCYNTVSSNVIIQSSTLGSPVSKISRKMVRFIGRDNFIISHRYSILVKQYVQESEAFSFYETLKSFSQSDNIFSQVQPGAIYANVHRKDGIDENVLGYVEAVGASESRLFFNYDDFFPGEALPDYPFNCNLVSTPESHTSYCTSDPIGNPCPLSVIEQVNQGTISYYGPYDELLAPNSSCPGPYLFTPRVCGDCTLLGKNVEPDFWME
ncbi:DUF4249 domain-containing protein [Flagellimonas pelagia]|uniref:DUF4249 domain-containing protein n=2 Tax=Flagellimonas pelagia TaxID=2306998 RepID=A0A3A1NL62_9FLAO|nr:DUF4249 domain-containing protein [Allomuricauda maritima]TXJ99861.1 DUF4249 domain-containing protein [Allomuricauda maritima]